MALAYELGRTQLNRPTADVLNLNGEWSDLISSLQPYYPELSTLISDSESEDVVLASFSGSISVSQLLHRLDGATTPKCVLLSTSAPPTSVVELLAQSISHGQAPPFEWLNGVSLSREWLRPLLDMCRENLSDLLFWLARRRLVDDNSSSRLTLQDMQRILKLARTSEDDDVVAGALVALAGSRYIRLARPELIEKLIHAAAFRNRLGPSLFRMGEAAQLSLFADQEAKAVRDEIAIARDVAKLIVAAPDRHDLRTICAAAGFLAEEEQVSLPPLHAEEDKLGIAL